MTNSDILQANEDAILVASEATITEDSEVETTRTEVSFPPSQNGHFLSPPESFYQEDPKRRSYVRRRFRSLLRSKEGRETLSRVRKEGSLPLALAEMLEEMMRERREGGDQVDGIDAEEEEMLDVQNMREVMLSAVSLGARRRMRDRLAERGALRGKKDTVKIQTKATKKSRKTFGLTKMVGLTTVERRFGSAAASVFSFMLWVTALNAAGLVLVLGFIVTPELLEEASKDSVVVDGANVEVLRDRNPADEQCDLLLFTGFNGSWAAEGQAVQCCSQLYSNISTTYDIDAKSVTLDLFQGTGFIEDSPFFYGHYLGTYKFSFRNEWISYDFPLAYFLTMLAVFLVNLVAVVYSSAKSFGAHLKTVDKQRSVFSNMVFGFWDMNVMSRDGAKTQSKEAAAGVRLVIESREVKKKREEILKQDRYKILFIRVSINLFAFVCLGGIAYLVFLLLSDIIPTIKEEYRCDYSDIFTSFILFNEEALVCFGADYLISIVITASNMLLPFLFSILVVYERYNRDTELVVHLVRCIFLRLASLAITYYSIYFTVRCNYQEGCYNGERIVSTGEAGRVTCMEDQQKVVACSNEGVETAEECIKPICWETYLAQEMYKLTMIDFLVQTTMIFLVDFPRTWIFGRCAETSGAAKILGVVTFNVPKHVLDIVYSQTICWLAVFYAPLFLFVTIVKTVLLFAFRMFFIRVVCIPSNLPYSATRASSLFKYCLLLSFSLVIIALGVSQSEVQPSSACGPFRDICSGDRDCTIFDYIGELIERSASDALKDITLFLLQGAVLYPIALLLLLVAYGYYAFGYAQLRVVKQLRRQLADVHREKAMLQKQLTQMHSDEGNGSFRRRSNRSRGTLSDVGSFTSS